MRPIRVAVADDSSFIRRAIARMLEEEPGIHLVGLARSGEELLDQLDPWEPDVVILDLSMPGIGGLSTLDRLQDLQRIPVIILSTHSRKGAPQTIEALHRGAVDFIDKQSYSLVDFEALRGVLLEKIRQVTAATATVRPLAPAQEASGLRAPVAAPYSGTAAAAAGTAPELVLVGASTGGPPAIEGILRDLGAGEAAVPVPVLVVQHMPAGFTRAFAERLDALLPLRVREAAGGEPLLPGTVYIARGGIHLRVLRNGDELQAVLGPEPQEILHCPSVDILFRSAVAAVGGRAIAVLLTGMGQDGAAGMADLAREGAHTIAQDEDSCVVYGMPRAAVAAGGVRETLPLKSIGCRLRQLLSKPGGVPGA